MVQPWLSEHFAPGPHVCVSLEAVWGISWISYGQTYSNKIHLHFSFLFVSYYLLYTAAVYCYRLFALPFPGGKYYRHEEKSRADRSMWSFYPWGFCRRCCKTLDSPFCLEPKKSRMQCEQLPLAASLLPYITHHTSDRIWILSS